MTEGAFSWDRFVDKVMPPRADATVGHRRRLRRHRRVPRERRVEVPHRRRPGRGRRLCHLLIPLRRDAIPRPPRRPTSPRLLRFQAEQCAVNGSPLYGTLLDAAAVDVEDAGPCLDVLRGHETDPARHGARPAVHGRRAPHRRSKATRPSSRRSTRRRAARSKPVIRGRRFARSSPRTSTCSASGSPTVCRRTRSVGPRRSRPCFLTVAIETGLPLRVLEVGASAGLNMRWDRFHYEDGDDSWGSDASPVRLEGRWSGTPRPWSEAPSRTASSSSGPDAIRSPIDAIGDNGRQKLRSFVWPDQVERLALLDAAIEAAAVTPGDDRSRRKRRRGSATGSPSRWRVLRPSSSTRSSCST